MAILLDTMVLYELMEDLPLSEKNRTFLEERSGAIYVSTASIWEMRLKYQARRPSGARKSPYDPEAVIAVLQDVGIEILPITPEDAAHPLTPPLAHKDPFDELLLVHAQRHGLKLATTDTHLIEHPLGIGL